MPEGSSANASGTLARSETETEKEQTDKPAWIESGEANLIFGAMILINAFAIGFETDYRDPYNKDLKWDIVEYTFLFIFTVEMLLRMARFKCKYFYDGWNVFDFVLVGSGYVSLAIVAALPEQSTDSFVGMLTTLRTIRLLRLCRVLRLFRFFKELWILAQGIIQATRALGWVMVLLLMVLFIVAIFMTRTLGQDPNTLAEVEQGGCKYLDDEEAMTDGCRTDEYFGTVLRSMLTLFIVMTLEGWPDVARVTMRHFSPYMALVFVGFIMVVNITLLNLVTGIIVENVLTISRQDELEKLQLQQKERQNRLKTLEKVFRMADVDESGDVSKSEFETSIQDKEIIQMLMSIDITVLDAEDLFQILDVDGSGSISLTEFIEGFSRVKGPALAKHLLKLHYDLQKQMKNLGKEVLSLGDGGVTFETELLQRIEEMDARVTALVRHNKGGSAAPPPEVTPAAEDEKKQLAEDLARHYSAISRIMDRMREIQAEKPGGYTPPAASPQAGDSTDLLHTMRGLCSKSDKLLAQLTTKNFLGLPNQQ
jgi:voltage-gated sodium channel